MNKKRFFYLLYFILFLVINSSVNAQDEGEIGKLFDAKNYDAALKGYKALVKKDSTNYLFRYRLGICILNARADRSKAIPHFEAVLKQPKPVNQCWFDLGKAYQYANKFDTAIHAYKKAIELGSKRLKDVEKAERQIETCVNAKELIINPVNVTFYNIGKKVNTEFADYYPITTPADDLLYFTSRRKGNTGNTADGDGVITSDIYVCENKFGVLQKPKNLGIKVNTTGDEQVTGVSADGKKIILYYDYGGKQFGDLQIATNPKKDFDAGVGISGGVNSTYFETAGCYGKNASQIFFASDRPGGKGGRDIYVSNELPDGTWSDALPLDSINTPFNEDFPQVSADGLTMYFASEGFNSMGGFDLFISQFDTINMRWKTPKNLGFPINTTYDEMSFSAVPSNEYGYMSRIMEEGSGDYDIYKVIYNDRSQGQISIIKGLVVGIDSLKPNIRSTVYVMSKANNDTVGIYNTKNNGKFLLILPVNDYTISIDSKGYEPYNNEFKIEGGENYKANANRSFRLKAIPKPVEIKLPVDTIKTEVKPVEKYEYKMIKGKKVKVKVVEKNTSELKAITDTIKKTDVAKPETKSNEIKKTVTKKAPVAKSIKQVKKKKKTTKK